jgi:hypothetical protein
MRWPKGDLIRDSDVLSNPLHTLSRVTHERNGHHAGARITTSYIRQLVDLLSGFVRVDTAMPQFPDVFIIMFSDLLSEVISPLLEVVLQLRGVDVINRQNAFPETGCVFRDQQTASISDGMARSRSSSE